MRLHLYMRIIIQPQGGKYFEKKIVGIFVCMLLIATALSAVGTIKTGMTMSSTGQDYVEWEYSYGGDEFDWLFCIDNTSDGGYIATGLTEENNIYYAYLVKVDENGIEEWSSINYDFNGTILENDILVQCVRQTPDGGYLVGGLGRYYNTYYGEWGVSGYFWKTDAAGVTEWLKPIVNEEEDWFYFPFVFETYDDISWMCAGLYAHDTSINYDIVLFKIDLDGTLQWGQVYDLGRNWEFASSLWKTDDGFFLTGSSLVHPGSVNGGFCMIKTDNDGNLKKSKIFDGPGFDYSPVMGCRQTSIGGYIIAGATTSYGAGGTDGWIIKTDADLEEEWNRTYGGPDDEYIYSMDGTINDGYVFVIIDRANSVSGTKEDTWILTTDNEGRPEWEVLINEEGTQWPQSILQTTDNGFIIAGRTGALGNPTSDGMILKVSAFPQLDIEISGGIGITATMTNNGAGDALEAPYELTVTGGILGMINHTFSGTIDILSGATDILKITPFLGFGSIQVIVKIGPKEITKEGFHLLLFSLL
jgi:hypothetical protein